MLPVCNRGVLAAVLAVALVIAGCATRPPLVTSQVESELTTGSLAAQNKSVVIMKIGAVSQECSIVTAVIAQRDGPGFKQVAWPKVVGLHSRQTAKVAEVELQPGEYHVVGYTCHVGTRTHALGQVEGDRFKRSYASFVVGGGEIVNVGFLRLVPMVVTATHGNVRVTTSHVHVGVTDWSEADLEEFKRQRPGLYGQMRTRLAVVTKVEPATEAERRQMCERMKALQAEGKLQNLPAQCIGGGPRGPGPAGRPKGKAIAT